jgi:hypothetical protein
MDTTTIAKFEDGREFECGHCSGSGVRTIPNGADDFDQDFCNCPAGDELYERGFRKEGQSRRAAEAQPVQFDISRLSIYPWKRLDLDWFDL